MEWWLAPAIAIAIISVIVYLYRRPVRAAVGPLRDIRGALQAAKSSLVPLKDYLVLNPAPWHAHYPGTLHGRDKQPAAPLVTGPVENFCAREELTSGQYSAAVKALFGDALPADQVHAIIMRVERVRVITPVQNGFDEWMNLHAGVSAEEPEGPPVVREAFEGTLILVIKLRRIFDCIPDWPVAATCK